MGRVGKTGISAGTSLSPQESIEQLEYEEVASGYEQSIFNNDNYLKNDLKNDSPIEIPPDANITYETKESGYEQVKYTWENDGYKYESRWHTKTPNSPEYQGNSWVVQRTRPGIAAGPNARPKSVCIMVKIIDYPGYKWVDKKTWNKAIHARKTGTSTKEQKELLDNGHWKSNK